MFDEYGPKPCLADRLMGAVLVVIVVGIYLAGLLTGFVVFGGAGG